MTAYHIELFVFLFFGATLLFLFLFGRAPAKKAFLTALGAGSLLSVILEIINERWFAGQGTVYPVVALRFYPFDFPVAIVLFTGMYAALVAWSAWRLSNLFPTQSLVLRCLTSLFWTMLLNLSSIGIEHLGVLSGWWRHQRAIELSTIYPFIYLFYGVAAFPATLLFTVSNRERKT